MAPLRRLWIPVVAVATMLASGTWLVVEGGDHRPGMWGGHAGSGWWAGDGDPVDDIADARERADSMAARLGPDLRVGEVMRFSRQYYVELEESDGSNATEVLVDPSTGAVQLEYGPAMMWNTRYGMRRLADEPARVSEDDARSIAEDWVEDGAEDPRGLSVADPESFPGYYTLHTLRDGRIEGMVSIHAATGAVWFHSWHGEFLEMSED